MAAAKRLSEAERKKEIMDSATKVIAAKGLGKATMEDIIAGTTLSKGGVYHYYGNVTEIFKDIMISGIDYRNNIIKEHLVECEKGGESKFMAKQLVDKVIDNNPLTPLYVEFLIEKKRNPELNNIMEELQEQTKERFKAIWNYDSGWLFDPQIFQFVTDFMNALIMASDVLDARGNFKKNRQHLEAIFTYLFEQVKEKMDGSL